MPEIRFEFGTQDASTLRARKIDTSGLTTAQRALIDARVNDACFFSSKVSDAKLLEKMRTYIAEAAEGKRFRNRADFIREMRAYFGRERTKDSGKLTDIASSRRLGLIFDFQQERLSAEIFLAQGEDQDHAWAFPCLELIRVSQRMVPRPWRERWKEAGGKLYDGRMIALRNDPIWRKISRFGSPVPPFDFNSGMGLEEVNRFEAEGLGIQLPEEAEGGSEPEEVSGIGHQVESETLDRSEEAEGLEARAQKVIDSVSESQKDFYRVALKSTSPLCREAAVKAAEKEAIPIIESKRSNNSYFSPDGKIVSISFDALNITKTHEFFHYVDFCSGGGRFSTLDLEHERLSSARAIASAKKRRDAEFNALKSAISKKTPGQFRKEADEKLKALGFDLQGLESFFGEVNASESNLARDYFLAAGINKGDADNVRAWWFARCLERHDPEGAVLCFASNEAPFRERVETGALRSLSDYIGTVTHNKSLGYGGCLRFGHSDAYYKRQSSNSELMAQFGAMHGDYKDSELARLIAKSAAPEVWASLTNILETFTKGDK